MQGQAWRKCSMHLACGLRGHYPWPLVNSVPARLQLIAREEMTPIACVGPLDPMWGPELSRKEGREGRDGKQRLGVNTGSMSFSLLRWATGPRCLWRSLGDCGAQGAGAGVFILQGPAELLSCDPGLLPAGRENPMQRHGRCWEPAGMHRREGDS